ncbi:MAG TPA: tetratricopeptide repeat protein [Flavobacterium sp.]|nr:tetratricopeptide repeat protein [Flavobacterium sp.]
MGIKKIAFCVLFLGSFCFPASLLAQGEPEDIAAVTDEFQDSFYESLTQKGIENYDRAITALEKCVKMQPNNAVVYFELGKNYLALKKYEKAYESYEKASQLDPKNMWYFEGMYDVCYQTKDYEQAIIVVTKLVEFKKEYKEDLTSLYMTTLQFDKALDLINELNDTAGKTEQRENYKAQILRDPKYQGPEMANLLDQIKKNPKAEANYLSLIRLYSDSNQDNKALEIAKKLEAAIPTSDWAQVNLFEFHISNNDGDKAIKAMNIVFASSKIDNKIKHRMLNEFLIFAKDKPQYDADLEKAISYFNSDPTVQISKEIGKFYQLKKDWPRTIRYYENHLKSNPQDVETTVLLLEAYAQTMNFDAMAKKADEMIELFPLEPQFYYYSGLGYYNLGNARKAKDLLETGLDYVVNNPELEANFNYQLGYTYQKLGDEKKAAAFFAKAEPQRKQAKKQ